MGLIDIITRKEHKQYKRILNLIQRHKYAVLFIMDDDERFGLSNNKYIEAILSKLENEALENPYVLLEMQNHRYHRADYFTERVLSKNPNIIESLINNKERNIESLIIAAINNGYNPSSEYINERLFAFADVDIMKKLLDIGYKPSDELIEGPYLKGVFANEILLLKAIGWGYIPSIDFIISNNLLRNENLVDILLDTIELTPEIISSRAFYGNALAAQKVIKDYPNLIPMLDSSSENFEPFMIEAFKLGYIPNNLEDDLRINANYLLLSKLIKSHPEAIKYCRLYDKDERKKVDELALCMGYVPTINDAKNTKYIKSSFKLMKELISRRPEAIKYIETHPLTGSYSMIISDDEFLNLARYALDNGYIPTEADINLNPRLRDSFDIMKILVQENPEMINMIRDVTPNKEELLSIAIREGFDGELVSHYTGESITPYSKNSLLTSSAGIMYQINRGRSFDSELTYQNNYGMDLYNFLIEKGEKIEDIFHLFRGNLEVMREVISKHPEMITNISIHFSRKEIDELCFLAIESGYVPTVDDDIFGFGSDVTLMMVRKYPEFLEKVNLIDGVGFVSALSPIYHEVCKIAADAGFIPDVETMGNGYGNVTTTEYNSSYDIMKKAIPLKPSLIESCSVENKDEYDELCRLAIVCGYELKDEYALTHWGKKMCSSYDLMAKYIKEHPYFITEVSITDSNELLSIIDIAIESGFDLNTLTSSELIKLFLNIDEDKASKYLDQSNLDALRKARLLRVNNDEVSKTVNPKFLSDRIISRLTEEQVEILSCYPNIQERMVSLPSKDIRTDIVYELIDQYKDNLEWVPILERVLNNIFSSEYINLFESIKDTQLSKDDKRNLMLLLMTDNHLDISCYRDLRNISSIRKEYVDTLLNRDTVESLKTAYFERVYGIDLASAINLVNIYGGSLDSKAISNLDEESKKDFVILKNMRDIINQKSKSILRFYLDNVNPDFVIEPDLMITYEARLRYLFTKEFNKSFVKPVLTDRVETGELGEEDLDIYLAAGRDGNKKVRMMITSIGAYTNMEEPDDYYASWNVNKIASHGCCCSYVGEKNLGTAEVKYCCLGFTDYELGSLQLSGPYDLCSISTNESYQISSTYSSMYLLPDDLLAYTRHTHNETVWERRNVGSNSKFKKQPSYIVYFVDNFEDRLNDEEAKRQWESVKKASANFAREVDGRIENLPIMVVEREKIAASQLRIIESKLDEFSKSFDASLIVEIISDYESNYAGNRNYHLNIMEKYFPKHDKLDDSLVGKIIAIIKKIKDSKVALECIKALEATVRSEQEKYNNTQHGVDQSVPSFNIEESLIEINKLKTNYIINRDSILNIINNTDGNERQFMKSDIENLSDSLTQEQLSTDDIINRLNDNNLYQDLIKYEHEIANEKINGRLKIHGNRHIKNVLLYSLLIGGELIQDRHDLEILLLAAKYHDSGRKTDAHEEHSKSSVDLAISKLKNKCSSEDLSAIATIIEFHEVIEQGNEDKIFAEIASSYNVSSKDIPRVRKLANILKDADALDRTRFINPARLDPNYLHYDISKKMVRFASMLQETYALEDLSLYDANKEIEILLQIYTPQEIIRTIRHQTRGVSSDEEIRYFIKSWAYTVTINNGGELEKGSVKHGK